MNEAAKAQRQAYAETNAELEALHLAGVEKDNEAADALLIEQARLALYGCLAIAGGAITAAWGASRTPCMPTLKLGLILLVLAICAAWNAILWARTHRLRRVIKSFAQLRDARTKVFGKAYMYAPLEAGELDKVRREEGRASDLVIWLTTSAFVFASLGASSILLGFFDVLDNTGCHVFTVWPLTGLN